MNIIEQTKSAFSSFGKRTKSANSRNQGQLDEWRKLAEFLGLDSDKPEALSESTYYVCMRVLSESIGKLPCKLRKTPLSCERSSESIYDRNKFLGRGRNEPKPLRQRVRVD
ncbi:MAG: hypothetical protein RR505_11450 [Raoultibacter sp.]